MLNILALSSSRAGNSAYLESAAPMIHDFLGNVPAKIAFIPFASVEKDFSEYLQLVQEALSHLPYDIRLVDLKNTDDVFTGATAIMTGGGNTFKLLHDLYASGLLEKIKQAVHQGVPYIGWSAGANIAGRSICTTNDMPIIQPQHFSSLGFLPFQINPHYLNENRENFHGETRDQRLTEFIHLNPGVPVLGIPEGTALRLKNHRLEYIGRGNCVLFHQDVSGKKERREIPPDTDISFLMKNE